MSTSAEQVFIEIKKYWVSTAVRLVKDLTATTPNLKAVMEKCMVAYKDGTVDNIPFICSTLQIEGNDKLCVQGTILDVSKDSNSLILPYYRKVSTCTKNVIRQIEGIPVKDYICKTYCIGCGKASISGRLKELQNTLGEVFDDGGILDQAIQKAIDGEWKQCKE